VLALILQLRQACCHPFLVQSRSDAAASWSAVSKHLAAAPAVHGAAVVQKLQAAAQPPPPPAAAAAAAAEGAAEAEAGAAGGSAAETPDECPICLEPHEDAVLTSCGHRFCRECAEI